MSEGKTIFQGWAWEMFREYTRKIRRTATGGAPDDEELMRRYEEIVRGDCTFRLMVEEKVGMIVVFQDLEGWRFQEIQDRIETPAIVAYLAEKYGGGKYKVNIYEGGTFIATKNFRVEDRPPKWKEILAERGKGEK